MVKYFARSSGLAQVGGGLRGSVSGFSRRSRKRLIELLCKLDEIDDALFWTLTYPSEFPDQFDVFKRDLDTFLKRVKRRWPDAAWIWRVEPQQRGAPHYHLIIWNIPNGLRRVRLWVTLAWAQIAHQHDKHNGEYATRVERINSRRHAMHYASKYSAKVSGEDDQKQWGRRWGYGGSVRIRKVCVRFEKIEFCYMFRRFLLDQTRRISPRWYERLLELGDNDSFTVFGLGARSPPLADLMKYLHDSALAANEKSPLSELVIELGRKSEIETGLTA